jgi:hypothetical protein
MALVAPIAEAADQRRAPRVDLCLDVEAGQTPDRSAPAVIHQLSQTGFRMEAGARVAPGELIQVLLPEAREVAARVIWSCGRHFGCEFQRPLSAAALSAAMLKARPARLAENLPEGVLLEQAELAQPSAPPTRNSLPTIVGLSLVSWAAVVAAVSYASV